MVKKILLVLIIACIPLGYALEGFSAPQASVVLEDMLVVSDSAVYSTGFVSDDGITWEEFGFSGATRNNWILGEAVSDVRTDANFYAVYSCSWDSGWSCSDNWQVYDQSTQESINENLSQYTPKDSVQGDFEALQDIYSQMSGESWDANDGWADMTPETMNQAYGVEVDSNGRVTRLDVEDNNVQGGLPDSIGNLQKMQYFSIKKNPVYSSIPQSIENWADAEYIMLSGHSDGIPRFNPHPGKTYNWGSAKYYGTLPDVFDKMPKLKVIDLFWNEDMQEQPYPSTLYKHDNITHILLSGNNFVGELEDNFDLPELDVFHIGSNNLEGNLPSTLATSTKMRKASFGHSDWYTRNRATKFFTGAIPPEYANLVSMERFSVSNQELEGEIPNFMLEEWIGLREIGMSKNNFYGAIPPAIGNFDITILDFAHNNFGLDINGDPLPLDQGGSVDPNIIAGMHRVILFNLRGNNLRGEFPSGELVDGEWKGLQTKQRIRTIVIDSNNFEGSLPQAPDYTGDMSQVIMHRNQFSGEIPRSWVNFFIPTWWDPTNRAEDDNGKGADISIESSGNTLTWSQGDWQGTEIPAGSALLEEDEIHYLYFTGEEFAITTSLTDIGSTNDIKNNVVVVAWPVAGEDAYVNSNLRDTNARRMLDNIQVRENNLQGDIPEWFSDEYLIGGGADIV